MTEAKLPAISYNDPKILATFMDQPKIKIAEVITGLLASGKSEAILVSGRIVQGVLKGNAMKQLGRELDALVEKGKIKEDYAENKYGFKSLSDILSFIDEEAPDEDKFRAIKALFYSVNATDVESKEKQLLNYQLFKITLSLTSSQLLTLQACYKLKDSENYIKDGIVSVGQWLREVAQEVGHKCNSIIEMDEDVLVSKKIITPRTYSDRSGIRNANCRLTDIGIMLSENLDRYDFKLEIEDSSEKSSEAETEEKKDDKATGGEPVEPKDEPKKE